MSYSTAKGSQGERECAAFLTEITGKKWERLGGVERNKKLRGGDVFMVEEGSHFLDDYLFDAKVHAKPSIFSALDKCEMDALLWEKEGGIVYIVKQARGHKGERLVAMRPEVFKQIIEKLK